MVTQTIHIGDCELLEYYMDVTDGANPKWDNWDNREWLIGLNGHPTFPNPYFGGTPGNDECVNGWRGLTPLALNPLFGTAGAGTERMDPAVMARSTGPTSTTSGTSTASSRTATRARPGTTSASSTGCRRSGRGRSPRPSSST